MRQSRFQTSDFAVYLLQDDLRIGNRSYDSLQGEYKLILEVNEVGKPQHSDAAPAGKSAGESYRKGCTITAAFVALCLSA